MKPSSVIVLGLRQLRLILPLCWLITSACTPSSPFITMTLAKPDLYIASGPGIAVALSRAEVNMRIHTISLNDPQLEQDGRCLFTVDYPHSANTLLTANGDPGQPNFNVVLSAPHIQAVANGDFPCDPNLIYTPQSLTFQPNPLSLGVQQTLGSFTIETSKGKYGLDPRTQPFSRMEFTLTRFDRNKNQAVGDFRFLFQRMCSDPNDTGCQADGIIYYGAGSFLLPIH
jgi:hypothetical protein